MLCSILYVICYVKCYVTCYAASYVICYVVRYGICYVIYYGVLQTVFRIERRQPRSVLDVILPRAPPHGIA